jgi:FKBP-type peptidyl-prolyl cis-trans isomerase SlyD
MTIAEKKVASIEYTVKNDKGEIIDSSVGAEPLVYLHGANNIVPGLEIALLGKKSGDEVSIVVSPDEGYGEYHEEAIQQVPKESFEGVDTLEVGMAFTAQTEQGPVNVIVKSVEEDTVTIDGNHPLAGQELYFDVVIKEVRDATAEEIEHGHAHGVGGHAH